MYSDNMRDNMLAITALDAKIVIIMLGRIYQQCTVGQKVNTLIFLTLMSRALKLPRLLAPPSLAPSFVQ